MSNQQIEVLIERIVRNQAEESDLATQIKSTYDLINTTLQSTGNVVTKEVDEMYKKIDRMFGLKQERIVSIAQAKRKILELHGVL